MANIIAACCPWLNLAHTHWELGRNPHTSWPFLLLCCCDEKDKHFRLTAAVELAYIFEKSKTKKTPCPGPPVWAASPWISPVVTAVRKQGEIKEKKSNVLLTFSQTLPTCSHWQHWQCIIGHFPASWLFKSKKHFKGDRQKKKLT